MIRQIIPIKTWWCNNNVITREISDNMLTGRKPIKMKLNLHKEAY